MLRKLTSPRSKAKAASSKKELSSLTGAATADDELKGAEQDANPGEDRSTPTARGELKPLDLTALAAGDKATPLDAEGEQPAPSTDRRWKLPRSPRVRKNLLDDGAAPEPPAESEDAASGRRQPLVRSPRVKKNLLDGEGGEAATSSATPQAKPSPKRTGGLKALKGGGTKQAKAGDTSDEDSAKTQRDSKLKKASKDAGAKSKSKRREKPEAKALERHDERENEDKSGSEAQHERTGDEPTQPVKSAALSPLRRRKPAMESVEPGPLGGKTVDQRLKLRDLPPANQPEVHIIGEITSGEGFGSGGFACKWGVEFGSAWHHVAGDQLGQTQIDYPGSDHQIIWSHPLDLHFATTSFHGWPKLLLQVWHVDAHMKANVVGYGFVTVPFASGEHELTALLWRPMGSAKEELAAALLGRTPELVSDDVVFSAAWADRCRLQTVATGKVHLQVAVVLRNFQVSSLQM